MLDVERDLRSQGIITSENKVKDEVFIWGSTRLRIYTSPREYKMMSSDADQDNWFITQENAYPPWKEVLEILDKYPDD